MSYEKQTWQTGDTITAQKLNHMEGGIAQGGGISCDLVITTTYSEDDDSYTVSASGLSLEDIAEKVRNGEDVMIKWSNRNNFEDGIGGSYATQYSKFVSVNYAPQLDPQSESNEEYLEEVELYFESIITFSPQTGLARCDDWDPTDFEYSYDSTTGEYTFTESEQGPET